jgi:WD repeat-containing protein 35
MLVYLSKKIAIPHSTPLRSLSWCAAKGWIACGGDDGLLKVLKLEHQQGPDSKLCGLAAPSNLTMNQGLEAHHSSVEVVKWNEQHHKLTSSDQQGLIVVWMMYKGQWCEEMINNRNRSVVKDMAWSKDGQKICIVYEDGAVIVGSVGGDRMWGKDLKGTQLSHVQWSPNGKRLLFGTRRSEIMIHDSQGNFIGNLPISCLNDATGAVQLVGLDWYNGINGYVQESCPCLAVGFDNGRLQIMKNDLDSDPVKIDTSMQICCLAWNSNGSILAVGGSQQSASQDKEFNVVQFYNIFGEHLHTLRVPGKKLTALAWEAASLRMALAVDSYIYFANVRHDYKWGYFANTVVYYFKNHKKENSSLVFWNISSGEKTVKSVKSLLLVATCEDSCLLVVKTESAENEYALLLCNALGTPIVSKHIPYEPVDVSLSMSCVLLATNTTVYLWQYRSVANLSRVDVVRRMDQQGREGKEWYGSMNCGMCSIIITPQIANVMCAFRSFHIDEAPSYHTKEHLETPVNVQVCQNHTNASMSIHIFHCCVCVSLLANVGQCLFGVHFCQVFHRWKDIGNCAVLFSPRCYIHY